MEKRNDATSNKKNTVLANKIRSIFSKARSRAINMACGKGGSESEKTASTPFNKTQTHAANTNARNCLQLACRRRRASSSRLRRWRCSLKKVGRMKKMGNEGRAEEVELCKKRILMGEKCRALNLSGVLHYDKHGVLLPED